MSAKVPAEVPSEIPPWKKYHSKIIIGNGMSSIVFSAKKNLPNGSFQTVSIKIINSKYSENCLKEVEIMGHIPQHPSICRFIEFFTDTFQRIHIVTEFCEGVYLQTYLKANRKLHSRKIIQIMLQISSAIAHLHEHRIFHGVIKPANIMINEKADGSITI